LIVPNADADVSGCAEKQKEKPKEKQRNTANMFFMKSPFYDVWFATFKIYTLTKTPLGPEFSRQRSSRRCPITILVA